MGKHKHYDMIVAAAEGKAIQYRTKGTIDWNDTNCSNPFSQLSFIDGAEYRIKPEPEYPVTRMQDHELADAFITHPTPWQLSVIRKGINIAIRRAIQDGDVILPKKE